MFCPTTGAAQTASTATTQYVEVDGIRIAYRSIGAGSPLVLLTRMRGTLDTWDPLFLDQLAVTHRIITVDYPGTGYSGVYLNVSHMRCLSAPHLPDLDGRRFRKCG